MINSVQFISKYIYILILLTGTKQSDLCFTIVSSDLPIQTTRYIPLCRVDPDQLAPERDQLFSHDDESIPMMKLHQLIEYKTEVHI